VFAGPVAKHDPAGDPAGDAIEIKREKQAKKGDGPP
jgi:hypothetical protein